MHYLIDLDNTLLKTFFRDKNGKKHFYWAKNIQKDLNIDPDSLNLLFTSQFMNVLQTKENIEPYVDEYLKKITAPITSTEFIGYWLTNNSNLNSEVWEWIKKRKEEKHTFHIASDQPHIRMNFLWDKFKDWENIFSTVFTSANFNVIFKNNTKFFELVLNELKEPSENVCLIDDDIANITSAKKLGIKTILFNDATDLYQI